MKYDNIEINLDEFLRLIDEDSITYLLELGWSNKTKRAWQESLANIINGLIESSNVASTGPYAGLRVIHTTNNLNTESFNKKLNEIYSDVTWFLNQEMKKFIKNQELQKQEAKKDTTLPKFTNELFNIDLNKIISNDKYGGQKFTTTKWTSLDERDETGKRGTSERSKLLANYLRKYADEVSGKYDFTDSPFKNEDDLKERINAAIKSLEDGVWNEEDINNLNRVGINPDLYFDNGLNDVRGTIEGKPVTYGEYNDLLELYNKQKQENEIKKLEELKKKREESRFTNLEEYNLPFLTGSHPLNLSSFIEGPVFRSIAEQYNTEENLILGLNTIAQKPGKLDYNDLAIIHGAFRIFSKNNKLEDLDDEDKDLLSNISSDNLNGLKKIKGVLGIYFNPSTGKFFRGSHSSNNILSQYLTPPTTKLQIPEGKSLKLDDAAIAEIGSIGADIVSLVYPGIGGGVAFGTTAAAARAYASIRRGNFDLLDTLVDFGTGAVGAIPVFGDALMIGKIGKGLRMILQGYGLLDMVKSYPGLSAFSTKLIDGQFDDITVDEWKLSLNFLRDVVAGAKIWKSTRSITEAAKLSGLNTKHNLFREFSGYGPKIEKEVSRAIKAKVKVGDTTKDVNIPIDEQLYNNLTKELSKTGQGEKGLARRLEIIKKVAEPEIKKMLGMSGVKSEDITIAYTPTWRNMGPLPFKDNSSHFETTYKDVKPKTNEEFEDALKGRSKWDKFQNGSNRTLRGYRNKYSEEFGIKEEETVKQQQGELPRQQLGELPKQQLQLDVKKQVPHGKVNMKELDLNTNEVINFNKSYGFFDNNKPNITPGFGGENIKSGELTVDFGGKKITFKVSDSDLKDVDVNKANLNGKVALIRGKIAKLLHEASKNANIEETAKIIRDLKSRGWLKQGGIIKNKYIL